MTPTLLLAGVAFVVVVVVVAALLRRMAGLGNAPLSPLPPPATPASMAPGSTDDVQRLMAVGNKIGAIKLVREQTGMGLKESKDYVEALERSLPMLPTPPAQTAPPVDSSTLDPEVLLLLAQHQKIGAIKLVRERTGLGLKESKDYVEALERTRRV